MSFTSWWKVIKTSGEKKRTPIQETKCNHDLQQCRVANDVYIIVIIASLNTKGRQEETRRVVHGKQRQF